MGQISNQALTVLVLAAVVVSVAGTIVSINKVNQIFSGEVTGMAASTTGIVNVTLASIASIAIDDGQITFGSCLPNGSVGCNATSNSTGDPGCCSSNGIWPDNITVRNDGNTNINVTVQTNILASSMIGGVTPYGAEMYYSVRNASANAGCFNVTGPEEIGSPFDDTFGMQWDWRNFSAANTAYLACRNLTPVVTANSFSLFAKVFIPADAPQKTGANATLTFTAANW